MSSDKENAGKLHYDMMKRCYNPKSIMYKDYGAKGITVCQEWHDREVFRKWAIENGYKKGLKLERIDGSKGYSPDNCRLGTTMVRKNSHARIVREHRKEMKAMANLSKKYSKSRLYRIYKGMIGRCYNTSRDCYDSYGGRGIKVCDQWLGKDGYFYFYKWAMENGYHDILSLDRIDNDGNYSPENCRWATQRMQTRNRRNTVRYEYKGKMRTIPEIAEMERLNENMLRYRIREKGMSAADAVSELKEMIINQIFKELNSYATRT